MEFEGLQRNRKIPSLTPLIDIVFLLLVFFMLTAHFVKDEVLDISLPEAESATTLDNENAIEIVLDKQGHILIKDERIAPEKLEETIKQLLSGRKNKQIILKGDEIAQLGLTVKVMDAVRKAGATSLDIVTRKP